MPCFVFQMRMEGFKKVSEDMERVIEKDDSGSSVAGSEEGKGMPLTCREQLQHILHSPKFQIIIVCLVIFDCLLVIGELLIDLKMLELDEESPVPHVSFADTYMVLITNPVTELVHQSTISVHKKLLTMKIK